MMGTLQTKQKSITADFTAWPTIATKGDLIRLLDRDGQPYVRINMIANDGSNRVVVAVETAKP